MMASHGCGQRIGFGRVLGLASLVAIVWGGGSGQARACHLHHPRATAGHSVGAETFSAAVGGNSTVHSQQILNPTSIVPQVPPLTPTTAPTITTTATTAPAVVMPPVSLTPSPLTKPAAADQIVPSAPPAVSAWHDAGTSTSSWTCPPVKAPVEIVPPLAQQGVNPPSPLLPPLAANTPEPSTIVSALVMLGAVTAWRRRSRRVG